MRGSEWITFLLPRCLVGIVTFRVFLFQYMQPVGLISNNSHKTLTGQSASDPQHPLCLLDRRSTLAGDPRVVKRPAQASPRHVHSKEFFAHLSSRGQSTVAH